MVRRRFRYDPATKEMIEVEVVNVVDDLPMVRGDIPPFLSPLDGTIVAGRAAYYEHMRKHNVVPFEAGDEKRRPPPPDPQPRRELIWELVSRGRNVKR
jgi:hypothetical protein